MSQDEEARSPSEGRSALWKNPVVIAAIITAILTALTAIVVAILNFQSTRLQVERPIAATQTAEARLTQIALAASSTFSTFAATPTSTEAFAPTPSLASTATVTRPPIVGSESTIESPTSSPTAFPIPTTDVPTIASTPMTPISPSPQAVAIITSREGEIYRVPANLLFYGSGLDNGLLLRSDEIFPFTTMKSLEIDSSDGRITATITLLNNETISAQVDTFKPELDGPTNNGVFRMWLSQVERIDFDVSATHPVVFSTALVTPLEGEPLTVPADFLEAQYSRGSFISAPSYRRTLDLSNGEEIPFDNMEKFEISAADQTISITLRDGRVRTGGMGVAFAIRGPTDAGIFRLDLKEVKQVEFLW